MRLNAVFLTGATGCVGRYILMQLLEQRIDLIYLLVRNPLRLPESLRNHVRIRILIGSLENIECFSHELAQVQVLIHAAVTWGGEATFAANVDAVFAMIRLLNPERCIRIFYFSTASLLGSASQLTPRSLFAGTDYIRSKAVCHIRLQQSIWRDKIYCVYPTVVLGGDAEHPFSAAGQGLYQLFFWMRWLRFVQIDGYFHWIHARDIARLIIHWIAVSPPEQHLVLGNAAVTVDEALNVFRRYAGFTNRITLSLKPHLFWLTALLHTQMSDWDRYSLRHRFLTYSCWNPQKAGLEPGCESLEQMLLELGINSRVYSRHSSDDL